MVDIPTGTEGTSPPPPLASDCSNQMEHYLRDHILVEVFSLLDSRSLLSCRQVCHKWNDIVINRSELMKRLTINVKDVNTFLESNIAPKIKSISFKKGFLDSTTKEDLTRFFDKVGAQIEKLTFDFGLFGLDPKLKGKAKALFSCLVSKCSALEELRLLSQDNTKFLRELTEDEIKICGSKIRSLTINTNSIYEEFRISEFPNIKSFLLSLSSLSYLRLLDESCFLNDEEFLDAICEHAKRFKGSLKVIECRGNKRLYTSTASCKILAAIHNLGIAIKLVGPVYLNGILKHLTENSNSFLDKESLAQIGITAGGLQFDYAHSCFANPIEGLEEYPEEICRLFQHLTSIEFVFDRFPEVQELLFLRNINSLRKLTLVNEHDFLFFDEQGSFPMEVFAPGFPSLEILETRGWDFFDSTAYALFHSAFPNLTVLILTYVNRAPEDFFCSLAKLEKLTSLYLAHSCMTDSMLTRTCQINRKGMTTTVPAIAAFMSLRMLCIFDGRGLKDPALFGGLAFCESVDLIVLGYEKDQFTSEGLDSLAQERICTTKRYVDLHDKQNCLLKARKQCADASYKMTMAIPWFLRYTMAFDADYNFQDDVNEY